METCIHLYVYLSISNIYLPVCMYAWMYSMYVYMYVCMYASVCLYMYIYLSFYFLPQKGSENKENKRVRKIEVDFLNFSTPPPPPPQEKNAPSIPDVHVTNANPAMSGIRNNRTIYATKAVTTILSRK